MVYVENDKGYYVLSSTALGPDKRLLSISI